MPAHRAHILVATLTACGGGNATSTQAAPEQPAAAEPVRPVEAEPDPPAPAPEAKAEPAKPAAGEKRPHGTPSDPELEKRVKAQFGQQCRAERTCGEILGVDCNAATDGPYYYVKPATLEVISTCGGACMGGRCTNCPPEGWDCAVY